MSVPTRGSRADGGLSTSAGATASRVRDAPATGGLGFSNDAAPEAHQRGRETVVRARAEFGELETAYQRAIGRGIAPGSLWGIDAALDEADRLLGPGKPATPTTRSSSAGCSEADCRASTRGSSCARRRRKCWQDATAPVGPNGVPSNRAIEALTGAWRTYRRRTDPPSPPSMTMPDRVLCAVCDAYQFNALRHRLPRVPAGRSSPHPLGTSG